MAEARTREAWNHTSATLAMLANVNRDPKKSRPYKPADFNPYAETKKQAGVVINKDNMDLLKTAFLKKNVSLKAESS
jgi:hypothetical protein